MDGKTYIFIEQNVTGAESCASGGHEFLQLQQDGTLAYRFSLTPGSGYTSSGILNRPYKECCSISMLSAVEMAESSFGQEQYFPSINIPTTLSTSYYPYKKHPLRGTPPAYSGWF
jgi:hypothetical protein